MTDAKRFPVASNAKVSALIDIAIYTEGEDIALANIFQIMFDKLEGKQTISHKSSTDVLVNTFGEFIPTFDRYRVHTSDLKKVFLWFNLLQTAGMVDFNSELNEEESEETVESTEE